MTASMDEDAVRVVPDGARDVAILAAREAGAILRGKLDQPRDIQFKGEIDLVTDADRAAEAVIVARVRRAFPGHRLIGEEGARGDPGGASSPYGWVIDPLDGTTNYAHRYPHFAVSIGLERSGIPVLGVVYDPMRDELFVDEAGLGSTLNGTPIRVSAEADLARALLATGFAYDPALRAEAEVVWAELLFRAQGVRRDGSAALDLCWVAAGRLDGFYERPLQPWDMGAGAVIVTGAGGTIGRFDGSPFEPYGGEIIASNGHLHAALAAIVVRQGIAQGMARGMDHSTRP